MTINPHKLRLAQARAMLTNSELQEKADISDASLSCILSGKQRPKPATIGRIAAALGVDPTESIEEEVNPCR
jgi:transcriptional regulator with XRE-family HTH domain